MANTHITDYAGHVVADKPIGGQPRKKAKAPWWDAACEENMATHRSSWVGDEFKQRRPIAHSVRVK